ncbi:MAG: polymer-forming cytoskeletal protein [Bacillota bacterium]|nr:polymer-forming cytoskeletal protein [Bacillota bacterium]
MNSTIKSDLKISGSGSAAGGSYNDVVVNGEGRINGDIDCLEFKTNGVSNVSGNIKANTFKVNGTSTVKGDVNSGELRVNGHSDIQGNVEGKEMKIDGTTNISGAVSVEEIQIRGVAKVEGDCNAEIFVAKGAFTIDGLLNAGDISIDMHGTCKAKEIGGEKINVKKAAASRLKDIIKSFFVSFNLEDGLCSEIIEGDDIYLEYTRAQVVRGNNVTIGTGCKIGLVEYKGNFEQLDNGIVSESKKL